MYPTIGTISGHYFIQYKSMNNRVLIKILNKLLVIIHDIKIGVS